MNYNDFINNITDKNIISFGEATHGNKKITDIRIKLFKYLYKNFGYNNLILEEQYSVCKLLNDWTHNKYDLNLKRFMIEYMMIPWRTNEMNKFLLWIKKQNRINNIKINIIGIDNQFIVEKPKTNIEKYVSILNKKLQKDIFLRSYHMYLIFKKIYKNTDNKYIIWGHNAHLGNFKVLMNNRPSMGYFMKKHFKNNYINIGHGFINGSFSASTNNMKKYLKIHVKNQSNIISLLQMQFIKTENLLLKDYITLYGLIAIQKNINNYGWKIYVKKHFDYLILIKNETAILFL